jgi:hypothetical protein
MMNIVTTIIPIFVIILLGWLARVYGFIRADFIFGADLSAKLKQDFRSQNACCQPLVIRCRIKL